MTSLEELAAKLEIQELEARYEWAVDEGRVGTLADIFTPDATFWFDRLEQTIEGREAILAWFREYCEDWGWRNRRHYVTNFHSRISGDRAEARLYYVATYEADGNSRLGWGHYQDSFVKLDGRWWISAKRLNSAGMVSLDEGWAGLKALHPSREDWEEDGRRGD